MSDPTRWPENANSVSVFSRKHVAILGATDGDKIRFATKVLSLDVTSCWPWQAHVNEWGYGDFWVQGQMVLAHRFAYFNHHGMLDDSLLICHTCDNPACCNPHHMYLGTDADNNRDKHERGRANTPKGEDNKQSRLTENQVRIIFRRANEGESCDALAKEYGVSRQSIWGIKTKRKWSHLTNE